MSPCHCCCPEQSSLCSGRCESDWGGVNTPTPERVCVCMCIGGGGGTAPPRGRAEVTPCSVFFQRAVSLQLLPHFCFFTYCTSSLSSYSRPSCQLILTHSESVWVEDQSPPFSLPPSLPLAHSLPPSCSPSLGSPGCYYERHFILCSSPMVHLASDMGTAGTGNQ